MQRNTYVLKVWFGAFVAVMLMVGLMVGVMMIGAEPSTAAPMAAPTPVSAPPRGIDSSKVNFWADTAITADTTSSCVDVSAFEKADIYYNIDIEAGNVNTTTVVMQHGNSPAALVDGAAVVSTVAADAADMVQLQVFGGFLCLKADVTAASTGTITITANALVK